MKTQKVFIKGTAAYDLSENEVNNGATPEVVIIEDRGYILGRKSFNVQNVVTGAVYKNIADTTLIFI